MYFGEIKDCDIANGEGVRVTLFVSGCTNACPLGLSAKEIVQAYNKGNVELLIELNADLCMSCGTCSFVCPAKRPLAPSIALAKIMMKNGGKK